MIPIPIVPIPHLEELSGGRERYLALSHLVTEFPEYRDFLKAQSDRGALITLDNSAHEQGEGQALPLLIEQARLIGASELVIPDELFSFGGTLLRAEQSFRFLRDNPEEGKGLQFMVVPQGKNTKKAFDCLDRILKSISLMRLPISLLQRISIGISKDYYRQGDKDFLSMIIFAGSMVKDVHLLGWPLPLHHLKGFTLPTLPIRSTDSARAITYAIYGGIIKGSTRNLHVYPKRPENFFTYEMTKEQLEIAKLNLAFYYDLCVPVVQEKVLEGVLSENLGA